MLQKGKVAQVIGPVVDVEFASDNELPRIYDSLEITRPDGTKLILEVQSHIGEDVVRAISMDSTEGLSRDTEVIATGSRALRTSFARRFGFCSIGILVAVAVRIDVIVTKKVPALLGRHKVVLPCLKEKRVAVGQERFA